MKNTTVIALVGKGGVGKTSISALTVRLLARKYPDKKILAIDADPAVGLATALGVEVCSTVDDIRKAFVHSAEEGNTAAAIEMLYPYTKQEPVENEVICDNMWTPDEYNIVMKIPTSMSRTTLHLLNRLIHEFMVARVIYDWLSITHPDAARNWLEKALEAEEEINSVKNSRTGVMTRPSHPF